jgi:DNA-directed RNA polymerase subunit RPC12/RpoP
LEEKMAKYRCTKCGFETTDPMELEEHKMTHDSGIDEEETAY